MTPFTKLVRVSRESINQKVFGVTEQDLRERLNGDELKASLKLLPTQDEADWYALFNTSAPEAQRLRRKCSVCIDAEVESLDDNKVVYTYGGKRFEVEGPKNAYRVSQALERGKHEALTEMIAQGCITVDGAKSTQATLQVDEIQLILTIVDKFFFMIYI